jgi:dipeptide/tripeptide permease
MSDETKETDPVYKNPQKIYTEQKPKIEDDKIKSGSEQPKNEGKYPKIVFLIILNEFCERFSYYGIRTVLYIFLTNFLHIQKDSATAVYHAFTVVCYFSPVAGAIIADGYIGLYRTILYISCFYCLGEFVLATTSMRPLGAPNIVGTAVGLIIIALGTGGN